MFPEFITVMVRVTIAVIKHHDQKELGEERGYITHSSIQHLVSRMTDSRKSSRAAAWRKEMRQTQYKYAAYFLLKTFLNCFLLEPMTTNPQIAHPPRDGPSPMNHSLRKYPKAFLS